MAKTYLGLELHMEALDNRQTVIEVLGHFWWHRISLHPCKRLPHTREICSRHRPPPVTTVDISNGRGRIVIEIIDDFFLSKTYLLLLLHHCFVGD